MTGPTSRDVFISHSSKDKQIADAVCHYLEARSIRCWIAPRDVRGGRNWADAVVEGIEQCRLVVLVFSANANESSMVTREILVAVNKGLAILPFRIENVVPVRAMELFISANHWLDALTPPVEIHLLGLADTVAGLLRGGGDLAAYADPIKEIDAIAARWVTEGCPYSMLEGIDKKLQLLVREPPEDVAVKHGDGLMLLLMLSLHFGGNWAFWVQKNLGNPPALRQVLLQLNIDYFRPRFRALFALQAWPVEEVSRALLEGADELDPGARTLVERYVYSRTVPEYFVKIRKQADSDVARRATAVLKEIEQYWGVSVGGETRTELPDL